MYFRQKFLKMKKLLVVIMCSSVSFMSFAQHGRRDGNRIGISGGLTYTSLMTPNFNTKPGTGWIGGFSVRGNYYNDWSMIFGMQFMENKFSVETITKDVEYKLPAVQIRLLLSANLVKNHLSLDFGPVLQINDKLKINSDDENRIINGTLLTANDIIDVSKINGNIYVGLSAGGRRVRVVGFYQYGLNNFLNKLNNDELRVLQNINHKFKGNLGILSGQILFNL